jgi:hypothetical protein
VLPTNSVSDAQKVNSCVAYSKILFSEITNKLHEILVPHGGDDKDVGPVGCNATSD